MEECEISELLAIARTILECTDEFRVMGLTGCITSCAKNLDALNTDYEERNIGPMKLRYMNGEKVYVEEKNDMGGTSIGINSGWNFWDDTVQVCKHRDIVLALNRLFKQAEEMPEEVNHSLWNLIYSMNRHFDKAYRVPIEIIDKEVVKFDDPQKVKKVRTPRLFTGSCDKKIGKFNVIEGGKTS